MRRPLVLIALALTVAGCTVTSTPTGDAATATSTESAAPTSSATSEETPAATEEITVTSCAVDEFGLVTSDLTVLNNDDKVRNYAITISVNGADGNRVAEANAFANSLAAGQSAQIQAFGSGQNLPAQVTCVIANVSKF